MTPTPVAVKRGAALLDERLPGWRNHVHPETLDLSSACGCVLGELFGDYERGCGILGLTPRDARWFGFMEGRTRFAALTAGWRRLLA